MIDPTEKEAACLDGSIVVACNKRREVCALHQSTNLVLTTKQVINIKFLKFSVYFDNNRHDNYSKFIDRAMCEAGNGSS